MFWQSKKNKFLSKEQRNGLGVALNEAELLGVEVDPQKRIAAATFRILTLSSEESTPSDRRVQILFRPVGRVVASLRNGAWNDPNAEVVPLAVEDLLATVQSFGGLPVYGWEFFDIHKKGLRKLRGRLSLDWKSGDDGHLHSIALFQSRHDCVLDIWVWFDELMIRDPEGNEIPLESFIAEGERWWEAFNEGDDQTKGFGMSPIKEPSE